MTAVYKIPYHCPYCDQTSTRKWNLSTHIKRKHVGKDDPFEMPDKIVLKDQSPQQRPPQTQSDFSNYSWPQIDWLDPVQFKARSAHYENLLAELRKLSKKELVYLLNSTLNLLQSK